jgi:hypothetical protein
MILNWFLPSTAGLAALLQQITPSPGSHPGLAFKSFY